MCKTAASESVRADAEKQKASTSQLRHRHRRRHRPDRECAYVNRCKGRACSMGRCRWHTHTAGWDRRYAYNNNILNGIVMDLRYILVYYCSGGPFLKESSRSSRVLLVRTTDGLPTDRLSSSSSCGGGAALPTKQQQLRCEEKSSEILSQRLMTLGYTSILPYSATAVL